MLRPSLTTAAVALLGAGVFAQGNLKSRLMPVTGPIQNLGIYHLDTGTWTRNATLANVTGPDTIYNNSCAVAYYGTMNAGGNEKWQHRSAVPSPTHPIVPTIVPGGTGNDEAPGCQTSYTVNGFHFGYVSTGTATVDWRFEIANNYAACGTLDLVPNLTLDVTGLPPGQNELDVDLGTSAFVLQADGDGTYLGPVTAEQFGWSWSVSNAAPGNLTTGPLIAGEFTWLGGTLTGPLTPCQGTDGTIWDSPINLAEEGTGMTSRDFFRITGAAPQAAPGCYFFGGRPHGDFILKLYSAAGCGPVTPMVSYCDPGLAGVTACPCGNPASGTNRGCNNFGNLTGGATLSAVGAASLAADTVVFTSANENATATTIFLQGNVNIPTGVIFGAGIRCVGGSLKRLYSGAASGGTITRPGALDPTVSARSLALGDPISSGTHRFYACYYRDPAAAGPCANPLSTFNITQAGDVLWGP